MSRNQNLVVAIIITLIFLLVCPDSFSLGRPRGGRPKIVGELQRVIRQKEAEGCDVSEVRNLQRRAKQAMESGNKEEARQLLQQAMQKARALTPGATEQAGSTKTSTATRTVTLPIPEPEVIYTVAVPKKEYSDGGRITNFATAFETETLKTEDGRLSLQLDDRPVFLETPAAAAAKAVTLSEDSPFGLLDPTEYTRELADLNAKWIRFSGKDGLIWAFIEPERGRFDFAKLDKLVTHLSKNKINLLITVSCYNHWDQIGEGATLSKGQKPHLMLPKDLDAYRNFLQKAVERYDGDGIDDAPGSPVARYWQIQNEVDFFWKDTPQNYAVLLKTSYQAIKKASPEAKVVIAGIGGVASSKGYNTYAAIIKHLHKIKDKPNDRYFDIFDMHWASTSQGYAVFGLARGKLQAVNLGEFLDKLRALFAKYGYKGTPIWITEMSTYTDSPTTRSGEIVSLQTEQQHAVGLFKMFVYPWSKGVSKIFWVCMEEFHNFAGVKNGYYDHVGLIHNPKNSGKRNKKLAYHTLRLLIEKTQGVDCTKIEELDSGTTDVYLYKFMKNGSPLYIAWRDTEKPQTQIQQPQQRSRFRRRR